MDVTVHTVIYKVDYVHTYVASYVHSYTVIYCRLQLCHQVVHCLECNMISLLQHLVIHTLLYLAVKII